MSSAAALVLALVLGAGQVGAQTSPGTLISNQALVRYTGAGGSAEVAYSNRVDLTTVVARTAADLVLTRITSTGGSYSEPVGPAACVAGGTVTPLAAPVTLDGLGVDPASAQPLAEAFVFHAGEAVFARLADADQNVDAGAREYALVTFVADGDRETIRLTETAADSGVFAGYVPTAAGTAGTGTGIGDCVLQGIRGSALDASYVDPVDPGDTATAAAALDPISRVFDALTGEPVDGATLTLVEAATGQAARPLGDDAASEFPAAVTAGGTVTDSAGTTYEFGPGEFRFPLVPAGRYRLVIEPPAGYLAPSSRAEAELQALTGAPYSLGAGSFGGEFRVGTTPFLEVDVPVDPAAGTLFLDKRASVSVAAPGDFIEYRLALAHAAGLVTAADVVVEDLLPPGLRYEPGSARRLDSATALEPAIGPDGRTLRFAVGDLEPDSTIELSYVAAVVPGAGGDELVNRARALTPTTSSNEANAVVRLLDDLFSHESFILGRTALGGCAGPAVEGDGVAGVRVYLEDGRFAVSDEGGRFHFEGVRPGTHIVQLDLESLPPDVVLAECADRVAFAGTSYSRFLELEPGMLARADFALVRRPPPRGRLSLGLEQAATAEAERDVFDYRLELGTDDAITTVDVQAMLMLPSGFELDADSVRNLDGAPLQWRVGDEIVTVHLGTRQGPWHETVLLRATADGSTDGELATRALARFGFEGERIATPVAETVALVTPGISLAQRYVLELNFETLSADLSPAGRAELAALLPDWRGVRNMRLTAVGHSDSVPISASSRAVYTDNYALSEARARAVVDYLAEALLLAGDQIEYQGLGPDRPRADNATAAGRRANRRVELDVSGTVRAREREVAVPFAVSPREVVFVEAEPAALPTMTQAATPRVDTAAVVRPQPEFRVETLAPGLAWLWPEPGDSPAIPSTKVVIQHAPGSTVRLLLNGSEVSALNFEGTQIAADRGVALSRWRGVDLGDGPNTLRARIVAADGTVSTLERTVHFAGPPVRGELLAVDSVLVADGRMRPQVALRLVDRWGEPAREGSVAQFSIEPPYRSWWEVERLRENPIVVSGDRTPIVTVGRDGLATLELEPTTVTGEARLTMRYGNGQQQELRALLIPAARDWILVGLAEGTLGHRTLSGALEPAAAAGLDADYYDEGRLAFYAKGRVKGALLTFAFDSDGKRESELDAFGGVVDPDRYYTIYGDNTEQRFDAPSRERLYVKLERGTFLAMIGDFETNLTVTELSRYSRSLTGLRSATHGERVNYSVFAAPAEQAFVKDELRGNGTSGPYRLSRDDLLAGSDKLMLESRDRFRPDRIVSSRELRRHFDYDIDYTTGTIYFREPIPSRDFDFNQIYIVADYETRASADSGLVAGGRVGVGYGPLDSEVGTTFIADGTRGAEASLAGVDLRHRFSDALELKAEIATSEATDVGGDDVAGSAYLIELLQQTARREIEAYWRETEADFGIGQQRATEPGTRRGGVAMRNDLSDAWRVETEMFRQQNLLDGRTRTVLEGESRYQDRRRTATMGLRRVDEDLGTTQNDIDQAFVGGSWKLFDDLLTTRMSVESVLSGSGGSIDYPTRTLVGADVAVAPRVNVFGEHELAEGDTFTTRMTRLGVKANPGDRSQIDSAVERRMTEYGPRAFATLGMRQGFTVGERWTLDLGAERSTELAAPDDAVLDPRVPPASGDVLGGFEAGFLGLAYRAPDWSFTSRLEQREADSDRQRALTGGFYRERTAGRGFSAELRLLERAALETQSFAGNLRLGWAYRPAGSRWTLLERADWIAERRVGDGRVVRSRRLVNNFNAHLALDGRHSLAFQYAAKSVHASFDAFAAEGYVDLLGVQWRRRLDSKFDFGLNASAYRALDAGVVERGWGVDVGMSVARNLNLVVGYNVEGYDDADFSRARYTARGPFVQFRLKLDQASLAQLVRR